MNAKLIVSLFVLFVITLASAEINCNDKGECVGSGSPADDVRCNDCQSCTFMNCCNVRFTNPRTKCNIPGWRSEAYINIHGAGN